ncbi:MULTISPECIES: hypothetical protein [unclassified Crossiella]|uniref:hypothetical protein n=1 Tax=unclassified Crossiella TaxID=2620835 RepID=UPI001FFF3FFA|nr:MULTISPECIES: hypothetical protein [unclassified Crossiella]MCK2244406.1 hypothetical protein [Crossiella sp. S99.2]MCK2257766.1 hypothetical protein [Crossiella sp. S99.1]
MRHRWPEYDSLAYGIPPAVPGTLFALAPAGGIAVTPREGRAILFGRGRAEKQLCVGADDHQVSREHGSVTCREATQALRELQPEVGWTRKRVNRVLIAVRQRLADNGVPGLTPAEAGARSGTTVHDNLFQELLVSTTLVPPELAQLTSEKCKPVPLHC